MAKKLAEVKKPTKGVRPNMAGVPGALVSLIGVDLEFGGRRKPSPYDPLLDQLAAATDAALAKSEPRPGLRFEDVRAKASIYARGQKKGLRLVFAESGGALYVRMEGRVDDNQRESRRGAIRKLLTTGAAMGHIAIAAKLREAGDTAVDASIVEAILLQMMRAGDVVRQDGGAWKLAPLKKAS